MSNFPQENEKDLTDEEREYTAKHLPIHLIKSERWDDLKRLMEDEDFHALSAEFGINWREQPDIINALRKT